MTEITQYLKSVERIPQEALLGNIFISTVFDGAYDREMVVKLFEMLDLETDLVPPLSWATDAFSRAISENKESTYGLPNGNTVAIMLRTATSMAPGKYTVKSIVREERDASKSALSYDNVGELVFYKADRKGASRATDDRAARLAYQSVKREVYPFIHQVEWENIERVVKAVRYDYERFRTTLDGRKVRTLVVSYLKRLGGVKIKESMYFIPTENADEAFRLREAVQALGDCRLDFIPLLDLGDQRDLIIRSFQTDTEDQMRALAGELQLAREKPSAKTYARLRGVYDELTARTQLYTSTLGESIARTTGSHDVVRSTLSALSDELLSL